MKNLVLLFAVAVGSVALLGAAHGLAAARGVTDSYTGDFKNIGGTISFSVFLKDNGKPDEVGDIDANDVEIDCAMTGPSTTSPTLTGETAKIKHREFKYRFKNPDNKIVFKGELRPEGKAKGTFLYRFTETPGDECSTGGAQPWKAEKGP